jgi:hypothetical protein
MPTLREYLEERLARRVPNEELAVVLGVSLSTVKRRTLDGWPAEDVIRISRALDIPPVEVLVACGYLTAEEVEEAAAGTAALSTFTDVELAREILRRVEGAEASSALTDPLDGVRELRPVSASGDDDAQHELLAASEANYDAEAEEHAREP